MYKEIADSILVFEKILPESLILNLIDLVKPQDSLVKFKLTGNFKGTKNRYEVYDNKELFDSFNTFWFDEIEKQYQHHFLQYLPEWSYETALNHNRTEWKDLFVHLYENKTTSDNPTHIDFSGISFSCGLTDDYVGGELYFPRQDVLYKMNIGDIVLFPSYLYHFVTHNESRNESRRVISFNTFIQGRMSCENTYPNVLTIK